MTTLLFLRRTVLFALFVMLSSLSLTAVRADDAKPFLHTLFTDNMVLQRGVADPVWGWTTPGQSVMVSLNGKSAKAVAGTDGKWMAKLPSMQAGGPFTLTVTGPQTVTLTNVMVGDVWICSGQSNMEFGMNALLNPPVEIAAANYPNLRLFTANKVTNTLPQALTRGQWQACTPQTIVSQGTWGGFSAVGYFFGRDLQQSIHVPIGLIQTSWGGTPIEAWTSREALSQNVPEDRPALAQIDLANSDPTPFDQKLAAWYLKNDLGTAGKWSNAAFDDSAWKTMPLPGYWEQSGIAEFANYDGMTWFRRTFDLPASDAGKAAVLHLKADDNDTTWINGTQVGATASAGANRAYAVATSLLKPTGNVVVVRVLDTGGMGGVYGAPADLSLEVPGGDTVSLAGPWHYQIGTPLAQISPLPPDISNNTGFPTVLYNGMIAPLIPYGVKGAIWYQGEANAGNGKQYQNLLPTMITDWRSRFGVGDFPFFIVQLANFMPQQPQPSESGWAELREAQLLTSEHLPKTGLAVAIDVGDANDIHPKDKQDVGHRLALDAEAIAYGQKVEYAGPLYQSMAVEGSSIRLKFSHLGGGLVAKGGDNLIGFAIAGADGKFVWADAKIDGSTVVVSSPTVTAPALVRYAWADNPACNLYNQAGLPASPFRTK